MTNIILRNRGRGRRSTTDIASYMESDIYVHQSGARISNPILRDIDVCIRWGCTATVGANTNINTSKAIHSVANKKEFRFKMMEEDEKLCPVTCGHLDNFDTYPVIFRPSYHSRGRDFHILRDLGDEHRLFDRIAQGRMTDDFYISPVINKTNEYRVFMAQGRVLNVTEKIPENSDVILWNNVNGAVFHNIRWGEWPMDVIEYAVRAFNLTELDFGAVDVIHDGNKPYVLEINTAFALESPYRAICFARVFDDMIENGKDRLDLGRVSPRGGRFKEYIHPIVYNHRERNLENGDEGE